MANRLVIERFIPLPFVKKELDYSKLKELFGVKHSVLYASKGRYAIIHILKSLSIDSGTVLISSYMCPTVKQALEEHGYSIEYYDINVEDLNPSVEDIKLILSQKTISAVVVPSLYGNPSDLETIEYICKKAGVKMIDDAAQSYGAQLNGKTVGSFGDGGFFAFSPGKPTAGHMGAFYWSNETNHYYPHSTKHAFYHRLTYLDFYFNRYKIYTSNRFISIFLYYLRIIVGKTVNIFNDKIASFELPILGGILDSNNKYKSYRNKLVENFNSEFCDSKMFRVIMPLQGQQNNSKIVMVFYEKSVRDAFAKELINKGIYCYGGYEMPAINRPVPNCESVIGRIIELPIEIDCDKMQFLFDTVKTISRSL